MKFWDLLSYYRIKFISCKMNNFIKNKKTALIIIEVNINSTHKLKCVLIKLFNLVLKTSLITLIQETIKQLI